MNITEIKRIVQAIEVSIDATNPEETQLIADLYKAIDIVRSTGEKMLVKTDQGYDYRGVSITKCKDGGFTYGRIDKFNYRTASRLLKECVSEIDNYLDEQGATIERYRIKVGA